MQLAAYAAVAAYRLALVTNIKDLSVASDQVIRKVLQAGLPAGIWLAEYELLAMDQRGLWLTNRKRAVLFDLATGAEIESHPLYDYAQTGYAVSSKYGVVVSADIDGNFNAFNALTRSWTDFRTTGEVSSRTPVTDFVLSNDGCYVKASHASRSSTWKLSTGDLVPPGEEESLSLGTLEYTESTRHDRDRIDKLLIAHDFQTYGWLILKNRKWLVGKSNTISLSLPNHLHPTSRTEFEELARTHKTISNQDVGIIDILSGDLLFRVTAEADVRSIVSNEREDSLAFVSESGDLTVWRLGDSAAHHLGSVGRQPATCVFSVDGTWLLVCTSEACQFVNTKTGARQTYETTPTSEIFFSPNDVWVLVSDQGMDFVTISSNGVVSSLGRVRSVSGLGTLESISWSPAGTYVVCNYKGGIATYELLDGNAPTEALIEYLRRRWSTGPSGTQLKTLGLSQFRW